MRNTSATPERVPVRFPAFLKIAKPLAALGPELLRIHLLAGRAESVLVIAGSIGVSAAILALVAHGVSWSSLLLASLMDAAPSIIMSETWSSLAVVLTA